MQSLRTLLAVGIAAASFTAVAQTANTPGGQAATGTPLDQTNSTPAKTTPKSTSTTPDATNPSGSVTHGTPSTSTTGAPMRTSPATGKATTAVPPGNVPTYPAPARDGTPTK